MTDFMREEISQEQKNKMMTDFPVPGEKTVTYLYLTELGAEPAIKYIFCCHAGWHAFGYLAFESS